MKEVYNTVTVRGSPRGYDRYTSRMNKGKAIAGYRRSYQTYRNSNGVVYDNVYYNKVTNNTSAILRYVFLILLFLALVNFLTGNEPISFKQFLDILGGAPSIPLDRIATLFVSVDTSKLGIFKELVEFLLGLVKLFLFLLAGITQILMYVAYFLRELFCLGVYWH